MAGPSPAKTVEMSAPSDASSKLVGTWQLVSVKFEPADTGEAVDMYGPDPLGYLILTAEGRMMVIQTSRNRQPPRNDADLAELFKSLIAYTGRYRVEGNDHFVTTVDVAWHPAWLGTEQARAFVLEGGVLSIVTVGMSHPNFPGRSGRAVLRWKRA
jgi:lipocalin-like protein